MPRVAPARRWPSSIHPGISRGSAPALISNSGGQSLTWLIRGSFGEADRKTCGLGEQVGAPGNYVGDAGRGFGFFGLGRGAHVPCHSAGDPRFQNPFGVTLNHPAIVEHIFELEASFQPVRTFLTSSRARGARRTRLSARVRPSAARCALIPVRRDSCPTAVGLNPGTLARRAPPAALGPGGPRRRRRAPGPGSRPRQLSAATSQRKRAPCKRCHPPGAPFLNRVRSPSRARLRRVLRMAQAPLLTVIFHGSFGAYRKDGQIRSLLRRAHALPGSCSSRSSAPVRRRTHHPPDLRSDLP